ncbi:MAG: hypothetical protein KKB82_05600 [Candidatus Omnitrophica bacterium]|nr:hypothetical protein [Candidatus Omnitrophota bacterium]MBU1925381.1 hypothetical protein [Candidatus Omnitrophota bacterium]
MKTFKLVLAVLIVMTAVAMCTQVFAEEAVASKYGVKLYGKIKADLSFDDSTVTNGNYGQWVANESATVGKDVDAMNLTASETRLGLDFKGPDYEDMETSGKIEVDFFDTTVAQNKAEMYMRHAYVKLAWPDMDLSVLAGQTWDVIAPLNPTTLNYSVMWWQGNVQYRRPMIAVKKGIDLESDMKLTLEGAIARNIGDAASTTTFTNTNVDTGVDNASPILEGRIALSLPLLTEKASTIGLSAAVGTETMYTNAAKTLSNDYDVNLIAIDVSLPLVEGIALKAEYWTGENLDAFLGGVGQGINTTLLKSIEADGGWVAVAFGPYEDWSFNVGYGVDDPDDADLATSARAENEVMFANVIYSMNEAVKVGLEVSSMETKYMGATAGAASTKGDATRIQASMIYTF